MESQYLHEVAITAIIYKGDKYLIIKRSGQKKRFPNMWTVPGGKLESKDYLQLPKDTKDYWCNVLERTLRPVEEEVGLQIDKIEYLTSLATVHKDGSPSLAISCLAEYTSGDIKLQAEEADSAWVSAAEAKEYDLIDGIYDELVLAEQKRSGKEAEWRRFSDYGDKSVD